MENQGTNKIGVESILKLETDLEKNFLNNPEVLEGLFWGYPRFGHPEGKVIYHVQEVLSNIDKLEVNSDSRRKLRILALIHDTFKYKEDKSTYPRDWTKHHGNIAQQFLEEYTNETDILNIVRTHDDAYYAWRLDYVNRDAIASKNKLDQLIANNADHMDLYYKFFVCDTRTGDKNQSPIRWFEEKTNVVTKIRI